MNVSGFNNSSQMFHGAAQNVRIALCMYTHVITGRIDPVDSIDINTGRFSTITNCDSFRIALPIASGCGQRIFKRHFLPGQITDEFQKFAAMFIRAFFVAVMNAPAR